MSEPFIGEIKMFGGTFAPRNYAFCNGQTLPIAQNQALFSILGTTYGGNGVQTFALPDLRSRVPMHPGQGNGLSPRSLGQMSGAENVTLVTSQMPAHNHQVGVADEEGNVFAPGNNTLAATVAGATNANTYVSGNPNAALKPNTLSVAGGSQPHDNMPPFLCVNFIIALQGIFPSRN